MASVDNKIVEIFIPGPAGRLEAKYYKSKKKKCKKKKCSNWKGGKCNCL